MKKYSKFNLLIKNSKDYILFNTLSGETFLIEEEIANKIKDNDIEGLTDSYFQEFQDKRIIIDNAFDENKFYNYYRNKVIYQNNHLTYTILLTWACNLRCIYCYEGAGEIKSHNMNRRTASFLVKHMQQELISRNSKSITIFLFGGEPLVNFKEAEYILEEMKRFCDANAIKLVTAIVTNGTLLTEKIIKTLIYYNCKYIQITLDGTKEVHDTRRIGKNGEPTFDLIIEKLQLLKQYKDNFRVVIRVNIDKINYKDAPELLKNLKQKGLNCFSVDFGIIRGDTEACDNYEDNCISDEKVGEILSDLWEYEKKGFANACSYPHRKWTYCGLDCDNNYTIEPSGEVYKCWEHVGNEKYLMGKIDEDGCISNITNKFFEWMTDTPTDKEPCKNCVYLPACGGGCRTISFKSEEEFHNSQCFKIKGVLEEEIRSWVIDSMQRT